MMEYKTIMADPPWNESGGADHCKGGKRGADRYYPLMSTDVIINTISGADMFLPADSCHLWLWATNNFLEDGLRVMGRLGFRYVSNLCWIKQGIGIGRYMRGQHELCLFGVKGPSMMPVDHGASSVLFYCPRGAHSRKPEQVTMHIERVSPPPRLELFARSPREGWDTWGNETDKYELPLLTAGVIK